MTPREQDLRMIGKRRNMLLTTAIFFRLISRKRNSVVRQTGACVESVDRLVGRWISRWSVESVDQSMDALCIVSVDVYVPVPACASVCVCVCVGELYQCQCRCMPICRQRGGLGFMANSMSRGSLFIIARGCQSRILVA